MEAGANRAMLTSVLAPGVTMMDHWLRQVALDGETGQIDIDRIGTGIPTRERNKISIIRRIIKDLEEEVGRFVPVEDILKKAAAEGITEGEVDPIIEKLKKTGDVMEAKRGFISKV